VFLFPTVFFCNQKFSPCPCRQNVSYLHVLFLSLSLLLLIVTYTFSLSSLSLALDHHTIFHSLSLYCALVRVLSCHLLVACHPSQRNQYNGWIGQTLVTVSYKNRTTVIWNTCDVSSTVNDVRGYFLTLPKLLHRQRGGVILNCTPGRTKICFLNLLYGVGRYAMYCRK
jgi:hypothetical protein